jgi:hypothetical protein
MMSGVFDRLQKQLDIRKREEGISPLELSDLPPKLRRIMRMMLREVVMKYTDLCVAVAALPQAQQLSREELDSSLRTLVEQNWLLRYGQGDLVSYKVNLRRKAGSQLDKDIWSALNDRIAANADPGGGGKSDANTTVQE